MMSAAPQWEAAVPAARAVLPAGLDRLLVAADSDLGSATADLAASPALLRALATDSIDAAHAAPRAGSTGWLRLYRPVPTVGFSRRDTLVPGYSDAVAAARTSGFEPAVRAPGGRAAAYHRSSLCLELVIPDPGTRSPVQQIADFGTWIAAVLTGLGVDARVGEVPGEYCPGRFSVNAGGRAKLVGTAGRRMRGAILLGASMIVAEAASVRNVLVAVYDALRLPLDPATVTAAVDVGCETGDPGAIGHAFVSSLSPAVRVSFAALPAWVVAQAHRADDPVLRAG